eukprot:7201611-Alexandrium_andersonii.AAC.1
MSWARAPGSKEPRAFPRSGRVQPRSVGGERSRRARAAHALSAHLCSLRARARRCMLRVPTCHRARVPASSTMNVLL